MPRKERESTVVTKRFASILKERVSAYTKSGTTQKEIAEAIGITPSQLSDYINDKKTPTIDVFYQLCRFLGVSSDYVFDLQNDYSFELTKRAEAFIGLSAESINKLEEFKNRDRVSLAILDYIIQHADKNDSLSFLSGAYNAHMQAINKPIDVSGTNWDNWSEIVKGDTRGSKARLLAESYLSASVQCYKEMIESIIRADWNRDIDAKEAGEG